MAPRKKPSSKSNTNQSNSEPSKFGIQHFFLRHSQSTSSRPTQSASNPAPTPSSQSDPTLKSPITAYPGKAPTSVAAPARINAASFPKPPSVESGPALDKSKAARGSGFNDEINAVSTPGNRGKALNSENIDPKNGLLNSKSPSNVGRIEAVSNCGNALISGSVDSKNAVSTRQNPRISVPSALTSNSLKTDANNLSQNTPPEYIPAMSIGVGKNPSHVSPEASKSMTLKKFKFSPGMVTVFLFYFICKFRSLVGNYVECDWWDWQLIKQSQDDGGDEVTWKISPVNERLQAMTKKHGPEVMRALTDASRLVSMNFRECSQKTVSF